MWPLGEYDRLVHEIKKRENLNKPVTFGLLIADYRNPLCKTYILDYISRFDYKSDKYINFYLPGYLEEDSIWKKDKIKIKGKQYYFNDEKYMEFLNKLERDFSIDYPYNPTLILLEYDKGNFNKSKRIIIELDSEGSDIKKVGNLLERIFEIAKIENNLLNIQKKLRKDEFKNGLFEAIVVGIDNGIISSLYKTAKSNYKYKLN